MIRNYLNEIFRKYKTGDASERTYYSVLEKFLTNFPKDLKDVQVLIESKNSSVGIPDFRIEDSKRLLIGYVEAKDLGRNLDRLSKGEQEQIDSYLKEYPKLIITNFIEFRLFEEGEQIDSVTISQPITLKLKQPVLDNEAKLEALLSRFFATVVRRAYTSKQLAELLAHKTHAVRNRILEEINLEDKTKTSTEELFETFKKTLRPQMTPEEFADMYAQTVTFGLFVARVNNEDKEFNRGLAYEYIPKTIPLLKRLFHIISGQDVPQHIKWQVDEIAQILAHTDIKRIKDEFFTEGKGRDPIIHFYETFLAEYDPKEREKRGVYYTPEPVVAYITQSIHKILKEKFGKKEGFADPTVLVLDPAAGTMTFPAKAIAVAKDEFTKAYGEGGWKSLVKEHILKNFYAFELLMAPYAVGHLKIGLMLEGLGYKLSENDRFKLFLTNTLEMEKVESVPMLLAPEISEESEKALEVKEKAPILVIFGNPPYSGISENASEILLKVNRGQKYLTSSGKTRKANKPLEIKVKTFIGNLIEDYKQIENKSLDERNPKWIQDDYVKFIRFAQWKIEKTGQGILGFITNHAWLDNPTFRGMRNSLMQSFDEIYILNLHGSALKKEKVPEDIQAKEKIGERDEGVFGIRPGTAITLAVKSYESRGKCKVYYAEQWGLRSKKFEWLDSHDIKNTNWKAVSPDSLTYLFIDRDKNQLDTYKKFVSIKDIFPLNGVGIITARDQFVIDADRKALLNRVRLFKYSRENDEQLHFLFQINKKKGWSIRKAWEMLQNVNDNEIDSQIVRILYRPNDERWIFYHDSLVWRTVKRVMLQLLKPNIALVTCRQLTGNNFQHAFVVNKLVDDSFVSNKSKERGYVFPLYTYNNESQQNLLLEDVHKNQNINWNALPGWMAGIQAFTSPATDNFTQVPEAIFYYIYTILYSNIYREKYREFLKSDFPRIPFTNDYQTFQHLAVLGEQLVELHLLKSKLLDNPISRYEGKGDDRVEKRDYHEDTGRLYINDSQYFDKVAPEVWNYYIGGYQVLDKWLKDRIGRVLSLENHLHFRKVITALTQTLTIQKRIDKFYSDVEKNL